MPQLLEYAPRPPLSRLRRAISMLVIVASLFGVGIGAWYWQHTVIPGWRKWQATRQAMAQWERCMAYTAPTDQVVYEEDTAKAALLLMDPASYFRLNYATDPPTARRCDPAIPALLTTVHSSDGARQGSAVLFCHERNNRRLSGERQALIVKLESTRGGIFDSQNAWIFDVNAVLLAWTGELGIRSWKVRLLVPTDLNAETYKVRFYAGQPDPQDETHFTIPYEIDGHPGIIDGWLGPLSQPVLKVRSGPATRPLKL